jgi:hypothetical protein
VTSTSTRQAWNEPQLRAWIAEGHSVPWIAKELAASEEECKTLRAAAKECANDLEADLANRFFGTLDYPSQLAKWNAEMTPMRRVRELLGESRLPDGFRLDSDWRLRAKDQEVKP